jgi:hypothetical protein
MNEKKTIEQEVAEIETKLLALGDRLPIVSDSDDFDPEILREEMDRVHDAAHIRCTEAELDQIPGRDEDDHDDE